MSLTRLPPELKQSVVDQVAFSDERLRQHTAESPNSPFLRKSGLESLSRVNHELRSMCLRHLFKTFNARVQGTSYIPKSLGSMGIWPECARSACTELVYRPQTLVPFGDAYHLVELVPWLPNLQRINYSDHRCLSDSAMGEPSYRSSIQNVREFRINLGRNRLVTALACLPLKPSQITHLDTERWIDRATERFLNVPLGLRPSSDPDTAFLNYLLSCSSLVSLELKAGVHNQDFRPNSLASLAPLVFPGLACRCRFQSTLTSFKFTGVVHSSQLQPIDASVLHFAASFPNLKVLELVAEGGSILGPGFTTLFSLSNLVFLSLSLGTISRTLLFLDVLSTLHLRRLDLTIRRSDPLDPLRHGATANLDDFGPRFERLRDTLELVRLESDTNDTRFRLHRIGERTLDVKRCRIETNWHRGDYTTDDYPCTVSVDPSDPDEVKKRTVAKVRNLSKWLAEEAEKLNGVDWERKAIELLKELKGVEKLKLLSEV